MSAVTSLSNKGILIQYDYCTGCHACEVACKKELGLDEGQFGIKVFQYGPAKTPVEKRWDFYFLPSPTSLCNLCEDRVAVGKLPTCVHHCQSKVMEFGDLEELAKKMSYIEKCVLYSPGVKE